ncbi:PXA domain-containing protein [Lophiotrema nucula]|uniref:PXA domain-containing protein n=1 Tax=Lophiotrema nucula TaxID=690887 RepID=A0A6A5YN98_9PLEO|nr:PXA domain-containing protein [Lophiotrema nucula]
MSDPIQPSPSLRSTADEEPPASTAAEQSGTPKETKEAANTQQLDVKALTDRALHFFATASNETLGACLVGLGAATYFILGRVGLVLIGAVGGVVLHATWESHAHGDNAEKAQDQQARKRELGIDVANRVLNWRSEVAHGKEKQQDDTDVKLYSGKELDFSDFKPETAAALTELTDAIIRDYVKWWYSPILPREDSFPAAARQTLTAFLISVSGHLSRKRPADNFLDFVTRSSSMTIVFLQELAAATSASPNAPTLDAIDTYLQMKPDSRFGDILDTRYQSKQLDLVAEDILQNYLDPKTYNCKPAQSFLKQVLANVVLEMIITTCSKPEWINGWIVYLLEDGEPELMNAIDAGVEDSSGQLQNVKSRVEKQEKELESTETAEAKKHKRVVSKAQEAMDEAMREAQRLSAMIAEEDAKRLRESQNPSNASLTDDQSESTTQGVVTPTSSQSDVLTENDATDLGITNVPVQQASQVSPPSPTKISEEPPKQEIQRSFTSFDQLVPNQPPTALMANSPLVEKPPPLTLHNCKIIIFDDAMPGEKAILKTKPIVEYLIQIEPSSQHHTGWMTARKYADFETLHEVLRRIAAITGTTGFTEAHATLPQWKGHTKASLVGELQRYINDAVQFRPLAESEGMKRFLEKETGMNKSPGTKGFPGWPGQAFENMGKGMINVLTQAPKEVAGGGKAIFGGVTNVLGTVTAPLGGGRKKADSVSSSPGPLSRSTTTPNPSIQNRHNRAESTVSELPTHIRTESSVTSLKRTSTDSLRNPNSPIIDQQPAREAPMERRPSYNPDGDGKRSSRSSVYGASRSNSRAPSTRESMDLSPTMDGDQLLNLPPIPSEIPDDYTESPTMTRTSLDPYHSRQQSRASTTSLSLPTEPVPPLPRRPSATSLASLKQPPAQPKTAITPKQYPPLSEQETTVLIELFFAVINELYTLASVWNIRLTLLNAAKTFLLRPGNPQLESIRVLIQSTLDSNTSDSGIAYHLRKVRANSLPTEEELKAWPADMSDEEKEKLRVKARKLLVERGMPQALTSVMGMAASGEAVGRLFDALQVQRVARGMMFGLLLQGMRAVTQ